MTEKLQKPMTPRQAQTLMRFAARYGGRVDPSLTRNQAARKIRQYRSQAQKRSNRSWKPVESKLQLTPAEESRLLVQERWMRRAEGSR